MMTLSSSARQVGLLISDRRHSMQGVEELSVGRTRTVVTIVDTMVGPS